MKVSLELKNRLMSVKSNNPYFHKDLEKASKSNKFIGRGSLFSSTNKYAEAAGTLANTGVYTSEDVVFVSVEGDRRNRLDFDKEELNKAISARVTFITDDEYHRNRSYNLGERLLAKYLKDNHYTDTNGNGEWFYNGD